MMKLWLYYKTQEKHTFILISTKNCNSTTSSNNLILKMTFLCQPFSCFPPLPSFTAASLPISLWDKLVSLYREISVMVCRLQTASTNDAGAHSSWIWQKFHVRARVFRRVKTFTEWGSFRSSRLGINSFYPLHLSWNNEWTYWLFDLKSTMLLLYWGKVCTEAMDLTVLLSTAILQRLNCVYKAKINVRKYILACFDLILKNNNYKS